MIYNISKLKKIKFKNKTKKTGNIAILYYENLILTQKIYILWHAT